MKKRSSIWLVVLGLVAAAAAGWLVYRTYQARAVAHETTRLAAALRLTPTSRVADVGAGNGAYLLALAYVVVRELTQVGFILLTRIEDWPGGQYCLVFERP